MGKSGGIFRKTLKADIFVNAEDFEKKAEIRDLNKAVYRIMVYTYVGCRGEGVGESWGNMEQTFAKH